MSVIESLDTEDYRIASTIAAFYIIGTEDKYGNEVDSIGNMIKSIVREHHWSMQIIDELYLDDLDIYGLQYWYNDVKEVSEQLKTKK